MLLFLCKFPIRKAGRRSGLAELHAFGLAVVREHTERGCELDDPVGRRLIWVAETGTRENRKIQRCELLVPLGDPSPDRGRAAENIHTRIACSRVQDELMHPVLAARNRRLPVERHGATTMPDTDTIMDPIHPGEILLEDYLNPLGITQHKLAIAIAVPRDESTK